uniref:Ig-like domain-containing protein n=1 Tax=Gouania willdenowi TaxID=441366 RepID=A0A8C5I5J5_GOUWI
VFCCELSKPGAPVDWKKGRVLLKAGKKYDMKLEGRLNKLTIHNVEDSDAGKYSCKTKDSHSSAELIVEGNINANVIFVTEGNSVLLRCELNKPAPSVEWRRGTELLRSGDKYQMRKKDLLYNNTCNKFKPDKNNITFVLPPYFKKGLQNVKADEGTSANLSCELSKPYISVQWKKNKLLLRASSHKYEMKQEGCLIGLKIKEVELEDSGNYTCQAGSAETTATLTVNGVCMEDQDASPSIHPFIHSFINSSIL